MRFRNWHIFAFAFAVMLCALPAFPLERAHATSVEQLGHNYRVAVQAYEEAVVEQAQNADEIVELEASIAQNEETLARTREQLGGTVKALYKSECGHNPLLDIVLSSESFYDAVVRFDLYVRVESYYSGQARAFMDERNALTEKRNELEERKREIESKVINAKQAAEDAEEALNNAMHTDGEKYHQVQGNGSNCGATAFIVGVNILLNEERYEDNVEVWEGPGFRGDSTNNLALRGKTWLKSEDLDDEIGIEEVKGDIKTIDELREELEKGNVVVISSGAASQFQRNGNSTSATLRDDEDDEDAEDESDEDDEGADEEEEDEGDEDSDEDEDDDSDSARYDSSKFSGCATFPDGHWIVFYHYEDGIFYANDSSVRAALGAGVPYDEEQMKQWLAGRGNHFATVLYMK